MVQRGESDLSKVLVNLLSQHSNFVMVNIPSVEQVVSTFRKIFIKKDKNAK
jgi:hypothetical protein